jgi:hypothetical protein
MEDVMKFSLSFLTALILSLFLFSCSESTDTSDNPNVKVIAEMSSNVVANSVIQSKNPALQASSIDSIEIKNFRLLMSRLKFQAVKGDNDPNGDEHEMKAGPFLLKLDSTGGSFTLANGEIPEGTYSRIKFELHRFDSNELSEWVDDSVYGDFATSDRFTVIIDGIIYENGQTEEFNFSSEPVANLWLDFDPEVTFDEENSYTVVIELDPNLAFIGKDGILDPRVTKDANDIRNAIKDAFKGVKKK